MSRFRSFTLDLNPPSDFAPLKSIHEETVKKILDESNRLAFRAGLGETEKMHIVLLTEEMISVLPHLIEYGSGKFWIDCTDDVFELHLIVTPKGASPSKAKDANAPRTFMGRVLDIFGKAASRKGSQDEEQTSWSLESYIEKLKQQDPDNKSDEWDELEHSILANIADDVIVKTEKSDVEFVIIKKVTPQEYSFK